MLVDLAAGVPQRAIIIAAGDATRWNNYLGVQKHFIEIDGEPIIHRTVRLLNKNGVSDVHVVGKTKDYRIPGSEWFKPKLNPDNYGADKFLSSRELWLEDGRTIILYGDCYFTDNAIRWIVTCNHDDWLLFARPYFSRVTGGEYGECFAISFYGGQVNEFDRTLRRLVELHRAGATCEPSGWQTYRAMIGLPDNLLDGPYFGDRMVPVDDWTDDFDAPSDYRRFMRRRTGEVDGLAHWHG